MGWLRKSQSIPAFPNGGDTGTPGDVRGAAFLEIIGGKPQVQYPDPNFANNADYGFDKNELVYACIMEKATSLPEAPFRVYGPDGQGEPRENHPLRQLIANPNPATTEFELIELTSIYLDLAGVAFWEIIKDRLGRPVEVWPLRPDLVLIFPSRDGNHRYGYNLGGGKYVDLGTDVLKFTLPNPMHPWLGQAPMRPANRAVALDNEATDFVKTLLQNHAVPGTVITTEQKIDDVLTERLTAKWMERFGRGNRGMPAFLQKGMEVKALGLDLSQLEFPDLRTISESRICMSFAVPPILVGAKVGLDRSTFANYAEARRSFWEETLMPLQKRLQQVIVNKLMPLTEGPRPRRSVAKFDNSGVLALRESEGRRWELATQALRAGGITVNQFNRFVGMPTVTDGDVYLRAPGVMPTDIVGNILATNPAWDTTVHGLPGDQPEQSPNGGTGSNPDSDDPNDPNQTDEGEADKATPARFEVKATRDAMALAVAEVVDAQAEDVMAKVDNALSLIALAPAAYNLDNLWNTSKWDRELTDALEPHMRRVAYAAARKVDDGSALEVMDGYVRVAASGVAHRWNTATQSQVKAAVAEGGMADVTGTLTAIFANARGYRADLLSTTTSRDMTGFGKVDAAKRVGLTSKTWVAGSNARPEHAALDGETVAVGQPFSDGSQWPSGLNCNCDVTFASEGL